MRVLHHHLVLTAGRSGSNFIVNTLNLHPSVVNYGEVLGSWTIPARIYALIKPLGVSREQFIDYLYNSRTAFYGAQTCAAYARWRRKDTRRVKFRGNISTIGLKDFGFLIVRYGLEKYFIENNDIKIIFLHRKNLLERFISLKRMSQTGLVSSKNRNLRSMPVHLNIKEIVNDLDNLEKEDSDTEKIVTAIPAGRVLRIDYSTYFHDGESIKLHNDKIWKFLGVEERDLASSHKKLGSWRLEDEIENYDEVTRILESTRFARYLY